MGTWIAEDLHHKRASGRSPYPIPRERETRCPIPDLRLPDDLHDAASEREDEECLAERFHVTQEAFNGYAIALCDRAVAEEEMPPRWRACFAELARQGRDLQQWQAELEGKTR